MIFIIENKMIICYIFKVWESVGIFIVVWFILWWLFWKKYEISGIKIIINIICDVCVKFIINIFVFLFFFVIINIWFSVFGIIFKIVVFKFICVIFLKKNVIIKVNKISRIVIKMIVS